MLLSPELLRGPDPAEMLQRDCKLTVARPTTVLAPLDRLQVGFRTPAIREHSAEREAQTPPPPDGQ